MLLGQIKRAVRRYKLLERGDRVVVGVSGGADSMALLHALHVMSREAGWKIHAAHLHHGLRGQAADRDLALVKATSERAGVPLIVERLAPERLAGPGIEARARALRYAFLHRVAGETGAGRIATGHTMDDQAETVLLRILRGSGTRGLAGIHPRRPDGVIRPLLLAKRMEVLAFLAGAGVAYREDETNRDPRFLRNRVRHEVLPLLQSLSPRITERLALLAERLRADEAYLAEETRRLGGPLLAESRSRPSGEEGVAAADSAQLLKLPEAVRARLLLALLADAGAAPDRAADAIDRIVEHLAPDSPPGGLDLDGKLRARWDEHGLTIGPAEDPAPDEGLRELALPGRTPLPDGRAIVARILSGPAGAASEAAGVADPARALFDLDALALPLRVRVRRPGDRMRPRGFDHRRKLKDVLIDAGVPRSERDRVPLVIAGDIAGDITGDSAGDIAGEEIIWAAGVRASERGRPVAGTARWLLLSLVGSAAGGSLGEAGASKGGHSGPNSC